MSTERGGGKSMLGGRQSGINPVEEEYTDESSEESSDDCSDSELTPMHRLLRQERKWKK
jgi:hypothetical protein